MLFLFFFQLVYIIEIRMQSWSIGEYMPKATLPQERAFESIWPLFGTFDYLRTEGDGQYMITTTKNGICVWHLH